MDIRIMELANRAVKAIESISKSQIQGVEVLARQNQLLESIDKTLTMLSIDRATQDKTEGSIDE
jgi:hypothetical protein